MAKYNNLNNKPIEPAPDIQETPEEQPIFETQAYSSPQPDEGSEVTVTKPIGIGGPVPVVAPKHNTIQLQPIVVPLAVVPYMSQDSSVLRTMGNSSSSSAYLQGDDAYMETADVGDKGDKKNLRARARVFSLVSFLLSLITIAPYILRYFDVTIGSVNFNDFDALTLISSWANGEAFTFTLAFLGIVVMGMAMLSALLSLIGLIIGKYPKPLLSIFLFIGLGCLAAGLIIAIVKQEFEIMQNLMLVVVLALTFIAFILSIVFSVLLNKWEDDEGDKGGDAI